MTDEQKSASDGNPSLATLDADLATDEIVPTAPTDDDREAGGDATATEQAMHAFRLLLRGIRNINLYRHASDRYAEYIEPAHRAFTAFLSAYGSMPLRLGAYTLEWNGTNIYEEQTKESIAYRFFRDGVRILTFREGLTLDELTRFVLVCISDPIAGAEEHEDWVTRLWKEDFQFIEHVALEGFVFSDIPDDVVDAEIEKIVAYLKNRLRANADDVTRFVRLSANDLELELTDVEQVRGGIISGRPANDTVRRRIQEQLLAEERDRLFAKTLIIIFQILEFDSTPNDYALLLESFTQILDLLLMSEDMRGAVALLPRFDAIRDQTTDPARRAMVEKLSDDFRRRMVEPERLRAIEHVVSRARNVDEVAALAYLSVCTRHEIGALLDMLAAIERPEGRRLLVDVLSELARDRCDLVARRLGDSSSAVVRDLLTIIHRIDPPGSLVMYARCLEHENPMIRQEGLRILAKSREPEAFRYIQRSLADADPRIRVTAYSALAERAPKRATTVLLELMKADAFGSRDERERAAIARALGETRTSEALQYFTDLLGQKAGFFSKGKTNDAKLLAVAGLRAFGTSAALGVLLRERENRHHGTEVHEAIEKAAQKLEVEIGVPPEVSHGS